MKVRVGEIEREKEVERGRKGKVRDSEEGREKERKEGER